MNFFSSAFALLYWGEREEKERRMRVTENGSLCRDPEREGRVGRHTKCIVS